MAQDKIQAGLVNLLVIEIYLSMKLHHILL